MFTQSFYKKLIDNNFKFTNEQYNKLLISGNIYIYELAQTTNINIKMENWLYILLNNNNNEINNIKNIFDNNNLKYFNLFSKL